MIGFPRGRARPPHHDRGPHQLAANAWPRSPGLSRRIGIIPAPQNSHLVIGRSVYSAFPSIDTGRGRANNKSTESKNERWLATTIAGPSVGRFSGCSTSRRTRPRRAGAVEQPGDLVRAAVLVPLAPDGRHPPLDDVDHTKTVARLPHLLPESNVPTLDEPRTPMLNVTQCVSRCPHASWERSGRWVRVNGGRS